MTTSVASRRRSLVRAHVAMGAAAAALAVVIFLALELSTEVWSAPPGQRKADGFHWRYNVATGSVALVLLTATMAIGPLRIIVRGRKPAVHLPLRRVVGIWTAIAAAFHVAGGSTIHAEMPRLWEPFTRIVPERGNLVDVFGIAFWAGLAAFVIVAVLGLTSRDGAMRRLGSRRWKRLHRLSYVAAGFVVLHVSAMQYAEGRGLRHASLSFAVLAVLVAAPAAGFVALRRRAAD